MKITILFLFGILCFVQAEYYENYKVFRTWPKTEEHNILLNYLKDYYNLDFWSGLNKINLPVDIMVEPELQSKIVDILNTAGIEFSIYMDNIAESIKNQKVGSLSRTGKMTWIAYYTLNDINAWLDQLVVQYPNQVTVEIAGTSFEERQIKGVKISFGAGRKAVFLEGGIHAREWISPATLTYIINELLTSTDPAFRRVANSFDWYVFPSTNPDGYTFSHTTNRLWRKTRTVYPGTCRGADPNRNWNVTWGDQGTSTVCSSDTYGGPEPFSEKCVESFSKYVASIAPNMVAYLAFHSYTQLILIPYGHTTEQLDNYNETVIIGRVAAEALSIRHGTQYRVGNFAETLYPASGVSTDWVKQNFQIPLVYLYELRDLGRFGFLLPPDQIIPNSEETVDSLVAMFEEANRMGIVSLV